ncbi:M20/M25/M40 family metallo-hydrolase [Streptomyces sp. NPDC102360]|uniref:M20/M25/M40 family metallo-hydrolase n=1 Tax=Streptomyces sp. NPDC102360 TaxID=3366160 RepID=UPI0038248A50
MTLTGHLDTVPADASGWSFDPLSGDIRDDRLLGRGSSDMKAGVACILAAAATRIHDHDGWPGSDTHGAATVNVGTFHAGVQPNLVPDHAELMLDIRTVPDFASRDAVAAIRRLAAPRRRTSRRFSTSRASPRIPATSW